MDTNDRQRWPPKAKGQVLAVSLAAIAALVVYGFGLQPRAWPPAARYAIGAAAVAVIAVVGYRVSKGHHD